MECDQPQVLFQLNCSIVHSSYGMLFFPYKGVLMRSPNKFQLKYILEFLYNADTNCFPCVRSLECGKGRFAENASPSSESAKVE